MAKEELIETEGIILEMKPNNIYRVKLADYDKEILGHLCGKMKKAKIRTLPGDRVTVELSPYDLEKCRIIFRHRPDGERVVKLTDGKGARGKKKRR
jgi:translation initiation factor IF-1